MAVGVMSLVTTPAYATAELRLSAPGGSVAVLDGSAGDACPAANCVTYIGNVGLWVVNVTTGIDKNLAAPSLIDLNSVNIAAPGAGTITILFSDNWFTPASSGFTAEVGGTITGGGTIGFSAFEDPTTKFNLTNQIGSTMTFNTSPYAGTTGGAIAAPNNYALTEKVTISFGTGGGTASFDFAVNPIPEPASVALLGGVLLLTVSRLRRKRTPA
jgi:hypothetical protein